MDACAAREVLRDAVARQSAALSMVARIEDVVSALEGRGFGVVLSINLLSVGRASVLLQIDIPAGEVATAEPVELVDLAEKPAAPPVLSAVPPASAPIAPRRPEPIKAGQGPRWSESEKAQLVEMVARGVAPAEIARRLGRPLPGTRKMITKLAAQGPNSRRKTAEIAQAPVDAPAPVAEPVAAPVAAPAPAPVAVPVAVPVVPAYSPLEAVDPASATVKMFEAHLMWLYGGALDADQIACDLQMVELLLSTGSAQVVAEEFDWPKMQVIARWHDLRHGHAVTLDLQRKLLDALRALSARAT